MRCCAIRLRHNNTYNWAIASFQVWLMVDVNNGWQQKLQISKKYKNIK